MKRRWESLRKQTKLLEVKDERMWNKVQNKNENRKKKKLKMKNEPKRKKENQQIAIRRRDKKRKTCIKNEETPKYIRKTEKNI